MLEQWNSHIWGCRFVFLNSKQGLNFSFKSKKKNFWESNFPPNNLSIYQVFLKLVCQPGQTYVSWMWNYHRTSVIHRELNSSSAGKNTQRVQKAYFLQRPNRIFPRCLEFVTHKQQHRDFYWRPATCVQHTLKNRSVIGLSATHRHSYTECRVSSLIKSRRRSYYFWDRLDCPRSVAPMTLGL